MPNSKPHTIVGLDIGTTKVVAIVGYKDEDGKIVITGMGEAPSEGMLRGMVRNIDKTVKAIKTAVEAAESQANVKIQSVIAGIAGEHIKSQSMMGILQRNNPLEEISNEEIAQMQQNMFTTPTTPGSKIIHVLAQDYNVDNEHGIVEPVGMIGNRVEGNFHLISSDIVSISNIERSITKSGLLKSDIILEPLASAKSVLSEEEKEAGIALVDIGGGTTDVAIFKEGIIHHTAVIPFGGNIVTEDLKEGCQLMRNQAELLKKEHGAAIAEKTLANAIIAIPSLRGHAPKEISMRNLAGIIQARMEEIIEQVYFEIRNSGLVDKLYGGIVLTGGGSQLKYLDELTEFITGLPTRQGLPKDYLSADTPEAYYKPNYATGIGLMMMGIEKAAMQAQQQIEVVVAPPKTPVEPKPAADAEPTPRNEMNDSNTTDNKASIASKGKSWLTNILDKLTEDEEVDHNDTF